MRSINLGFVTVLMAAILFGLQATLPATADGLEPPDERVLAMLAIAYDINPDARRNLAAEYQETIDMLVTASQKNPVLTIMALIDLPGPDNSFVLRVQNGLVHQYDRLPDSSGVLSASVREYNMANGEQLGGFILWARQQVSAERSIFSFIGHGGPVIPADVDFQRILNISEGGETPPAGSNNGIFVWPSNIWAHPDVTDWYDKDIISPHDLKVALEKGSPDELGPIDVADLVHCFAGSIEELHELGDHAKMITASPNYAFYTAAMPGLALDAIRPNMSPAAIADALLASYQETLPNDGYPRVMVAVDSSQLPAVKTAWDGLADELLNAPIDIDMKAELTAVYERSAKYEATVLEPASWTLESPDALVDLADFSAELRTQFGPFSAIGRQARETMFALDSAVVSRYECEGQPDPSYAPNFPPQEIEYGCQGMPDAPWQFADHPGSGISLFAPLGVEIVDGEKYGPWQAIWYGKARSADRNEGPVITNSLSFIEGPQLTWANVISRHWEGETIKTMFSLPAFAPVRERGEIGGTLILPSPSRPQAVSLNHPIHPAIALHSARVANGPLVEIEIAQNGSIVFSDTVNSGYLLTGTHAIASENTWTPTLTGTFKMTVTLDADDRIIEENEGDNVLAMTGIILPQIDRPDVALVVDRDLITDTEVITTDVAPILPVDQLWLRIYQFEAGVDAARTLSPTVRWSGALPFNGTDFAFDPAAFGLLPGAVEAHVWSGTVVDGIQSVEPRIVRFNYAQPSSHLASGEQHVYWAPLQRGQSIGVGIGVSAASAGSGQAELNLHVWYPYNHWQPNQSYQIGSDSVTQVTAPLTGLYLIGVENDTVCSSSDACPLALVDYSFALARGAATSPRGDGSTPIPPADKPTHSPELIAPTTEPDPAWSSVPTAVVAGDVGVGIRPNIAIILLAITLICTTIHITKRPCPTG